MSNKPEDDFKWYHDDVVHKPMHPHNDWVVDRCADRCDDQLPLFSQVGRGLQGNGFEIELEEDDDHTWTILKGYDVDPHTGEKTERWRSDNINGGKLTHRFIYNPVTNPKTFQIEFTLTRPDGLGWTDITPAIPYLWDDEMNVGVATLFVKKKGSTAWTQIEVKDSDTPHSISEAVGEFEKLIYPPGKVRSAYDMPQPGDPWTVNLEYGKGSDIDVPTTQEEEADIAEVLSHLHEDLGINQAAANNPAMAPLKGDGGTKTVWDWIQYAIDKAEEHLHKDLGGGNSLPDVSESSLKPLKGDGGSKTVWDWIMWLKGLIDDIKIDVENPKLYKVTQAVDLVTFNIKDTTLTANTRLIASHLSNGSIPSDLVGDVIDATLEISYFDVLPMITIDVKIDAGDHTGLDVGNLLVVCTNGTHTPINLSTIQLPNRKSTSKNLKAALLNPENLSNTGNQVTWNGSNVVNGTWALYTGVGDPYTRTGEASTRNGGSPWEYGGTPYFYIMNRATGVGELAPRVDNARIYSCSYNMATLG